MQELRGYGTTTAQLLEMVAWLRDWRVQRVVMGIHERLLEGGVPPAGGRHASSTACQLTAEFSAHWLSQHFRGELALPRIEEIQDELRRVQAWPTQTRPDRDEGNFVGPFSPHRRPDRPYSVGMTGRCDGVGYLLGAGA